MKKLPGFFLWTLIFILLLLAMDQLWLRVPMQQPALAAAQEFYLDLRGRLLNLPKGAPAPTVESVIERARPGQNKAAPPLPKPAAPAQAPAPPSADTGTPRFLYVDGSGTLQFADRLEDVPAAYRKNARPLDR